jgi:signal transduction histidine kinase/ActR/RegA family two-component response regulator
MRSKEAALRWFNDLSAQGIIITDAELNIRSWNHWLETHSGLSAAEMEGRNLLAAYPDLVSRHLDEYYCDALAGQVRILSQRLHAYLLPLPPELPDMPFTQMQQSARIAPLIEDEQVIGTITIINDVTERVAREDALVRLLESEKNARAEAEAANRAKEEFLATVSHELRTPLNAIMGWVQILKSERFKHDSGGHALETIERNAKAQKKLIDDILDASRIITGKLRLDVRPLNLAAVIAETVETVRPAADAKSIHLDVALDAESGWITGDPNRLQQIVWNLLSNAIKFTPERGRVEVRLQRVDHKIEVTISDTGQGISAEFLPYVFDRFRQANSTTTRRHGGLGLGLAIVRHLVELHGGTVQAASDGEGKGATFTLRLPMIIAHASEEGEAAQRATQGAARTAGAATLTPRQTAADFPKLTDIRVLIVDDETDAREMLHVILSQCGAEVKTAATSREALDVLSAWLPEVLVSDIGMPDEDGYSLINQVRSLEPEHGGGIPAVALTGYGGPDDRRRLLSAGYQVHITKPVEVTELANVIARLAGRGASSLNG